MTKKNKKVILIFVKNPVKGHVKTRLAKSVGDSKALQVYQSLLQITKNITEELLCNRQVWYSQSVEENDLWDRNHYFKFEQKGENLGERMKFAFQQAFEDGYQKAVIIGSDCADLSSDIIDEAFDALENNRVVIGPSEDGGYYLLGMAQFYPFLFNDKSWSQDSVFEQTHNQLIEKSISHYILPVLNDIDNIKDVRNSKIISL